MIAEDLNLLREIFLVEKMSNVLSKIPSPGFSIKVQGKGKTVYSRGRKEETFLVRRGIHGV